MIDAWRLMLDDREIDISSLLDRRRRERKNKTEQNTEAANRWSKKSCDCVFLFSSAFWRLKQAMNNEEGKQINLLLWTYSLLLAQSLHIAAFNETHSIGKKTACSLSNASLWLSIQMHAADWVITVMYCDIRYGNRYSKRWMRKMWHAPWNGKRFCRFVMCS